MATTPMNRVIQHILATCRRDGMTDGELLTRFLSGRDDDALAALLRRHSPMVWGVCRRILRGHHDAEDAFQATFHVLVRKAATLPNRETVGNWLYGVAHQTAVRMRAMVAKRSVRERQVTVMPEPATAEEYVWNDLAPLVDEELSRLPDKYRVLIVLCDLEGVTRKDVARRLNIPEGTAASRLATARAMLAERLARRGIVFSGGSVAVFSVGSAAAPPRLVASTIKTASIYAAGQAAAISAVSTRVLALKEGVLRAMLLQKVKTICVVMLVMFLAGGAVSWFVPSSGSTLHAQTPEVESKVEKKLELQRLQGIWKPVAVVAFDEDADDKKVLNRTRLIIKDDTIQVVTQFDLELPLNEKLHAVVMKGRLDINPETTPKSMDWRMETPKLKTPILKVYEVDGDKLKIVTGSITERPASAKQGVEGTKTIYYQRDSSGAEPTKK